MKPKERILELKRLGKSDAEIMQAVGYRTLSGVRGVASRANRQAASVIQDDMPNPQLDDLQRDLKQALAEIALLRNQLNEQEDERLYGHDLGKPWRFEGNTITAGDIHLNTTKMQLFKKLLAVAQSHLDRPRRFIIAGDLLNAEAFGGYPAITPLPSFSRELQAAREFIKLALTVFDEVDIIPGNHDRRVQKATSNAISLEDLKRIVSGDERVKISQWGHCVLTTSRGDYRITHGSEYSVNQLVVADQLAQKYGQHIVSWHEHHCAIGMDRFKKYIIVNGGGLFDQESMAYTQLDDNKKPRMANGFVLIKNGYPHLFSDTFTDWSMWIDDEEARLQNAA